jgi:hypothetical protein
MVRAMPATSAPISMARAASPVRSPAAGPTMAVFLTQPPLQKGSGVETGRRMALEVDHVPTTVAA